MAEPVRRGMELKIVRDSQWKPAVLGGNMHGSIHEDILSLGGREAEVTWEDVYPGMYTLSYRKIKGRVANISGRR